MTENAGPNMAAPAADAGAGLYVLGYAIGAIFLVAFIIAVAFIYKHTLGKSRRTTLLEDYTKEAEKCVKAGKFVSAAVIYEKQLKDIKKAAELYEKGGDYRQAARLYDQSGQSSRAKEMYHKEGDLESAAEISVLVGDYEDAAKLFHGAGNKLDAAMMLERAGRKLAAVPLYREAGAYLKASQLLEEEGMFREAAEMFGIPLRGKKVGDCINDFYDYALKLEQAGEQQKALEVFRSVESVNNHYRDLQKKLQSLAQPSSEETPGSVTTLRSFIRNGKIGPRHALKLWIHMLRALQEAYKGGKACGSLSPETIAIDVHNNLSFLSGQVSSAYVSPEVARGAEPDACSDIYSAGVILYEMLMGDLEGLGSSRIIDTVEDVPEWLDEIVLKCLRKVRDDRYQSIELIFSDVKALSGKKKGLSN